jgi:hypothetical protein
VSSDFEEHPKDRCRQRLDAKIFYSLTQDACAHSVISLFFFITPRLDMYNCFFKEPAGDLRTIVLI